jgi:hypothetical protein
MSVCICSWKTVNKCCLLCLKNWMRKRHCVKCNSFAPFYVHHSSKQSLDTLMYLTQIGVSLKTPSRLNPGSFIHTHSWTMIFHSLVTVKLVTFQMPIQYIHIHHWCATQTCDHRNGYPIDHLQTLHYFLAWCTLNTPPSHTSISWRWILQGGVLCA